MRRHIMGALLGLCAVGAQAQDGDRWIERVPMGSGLQNARGVENARVVGDYGVWHAPQYMPGFPTAATLWPRVVEVRCHGDRCDGYENTPAVGRGEYLFFRPSAQAQPVQEVREQSIERPVPLRAITKQIRQ